MNKENVKEITANTKNKIRRDNISILVPSFEIFKNGVVKKEHKKIADIVRDNN